MNLTAIATTFYQRIIGDTGTNGLFATEGVLHDTGRSAFHRFRRNYGTDIKATVDAGLPVLVMTIPDMEPASGLNFDGCKVTIRFDIFGRPPIFDGDTGDDDLSTIEDRLYGDATRNASKSPTYGLHRWTFDQSGGWDGGTVTWVRSEQQLTEDIITISMYFTVTFNRRAPGLS